MIPGKPRYINTGGTLLDLATPRVMGILNITPDSFYSGSRYTSDKEILSAAAQMIDDGADILDVGGYSSRPGAVDVTFEEESDRVLTAIKLISRNFPKAIISVDTFRSEIAKKAILDSGAHMINDISGGDADSRMYSTVENLNVPYVLMHMRGNPQTMQNKPVYEDVVADILKWFGGRIFELNARGVKDIIIDPGFGFGKTIDHNFEILARLGDFSVAGLPVLAGLSRKSMIWSTLRTDVAGALNGTTALNMAALMKGADILRVHDVKEAVQTIKLFLEIRKKQMFTYDTPDTIK
jgi:dihydropteroate synthase